MTPPTGSPMPGSFEAFIRSHGLNFQEIADRMGELQIDRITSVSRSSVSRAIHGREAFRRAWWIDLAHAVGIEMADLAPFLRTVRLAGHGREERLAAHDPVTDVEENE